MYLRIIINIFKINCRVEESLTFWAYLMHISELLMIETKENVGFESAAYHSSFLSEYSIL